MVELGRECEHIALLHVQMDATCVPAPVGLRRRTTLKVRPAAAVVHTASAKGDHETAVAAVDVQSELTLTANSSVILDHEEVIASVNARLRKHCSEYTLNRWDQPNGEQEAAQRRRCVDFNILCRKVFAGHGRPPFHRGLRGVLLCEAYNLKARLSRE